LETSKVVSLTASTEARTEAPIKAPTESKHWPSPQLVSFQASTPLRPLKWYGRCDSLWHNHKCQAKNGLTPPSPFWCHGAESSNMMRRNPQWGPNNNSKQWRPPNIRLFGNNQFRAPPNPNSPNRLWGHPQTTGPT
jgi:hypothetical protein